MSDHTLLPCPFCGSTASLHQDLDTYMFSAPYHVVCDECWARSASCFKGRDLSRNPDGEAVTLWNRRADALQDRVTALEAGLKAAADQLTLAHDDAFEQCSDNWRDLLTGGWGCDHRTDTVIQERVAALEEALRACAKRAEGGTYVQHHDREQQKARVLFLEKDIRDIVRNAIERGTSNA